MSSSPNKKVLGQTKSLKKSQLEQLKKLSERRVQPYQLVSIELANELCLLSRELGKQLGLLIDRKGHIESLLVGGATSLEIEGIGRFRGGWDRLRGLRLVHTHLRGEELTEEDLTDLVLLRLDWIAAIEVHHDGYPRKVYQAHVGIPGESEHPWEVIDPLSIHHLPADMDLAIGDLESQIQRASKASKKIKKGRRALLIGATTGPLEELQESMNELRELAYSCGIKVAREATQRRRSFDQRYLIGRGKMVQLYLECMTHQIDLLIFNQELSGSQIRAISEFGEIDVWDRTQLILEIFNRRATSGEGKLQVELATLKYSLPRLVLKDDFLSRLTGGIGAKGPGETKINVLQRSIRERINRLEKQLERSASQRKERRRRRNKNRIPVVSIIGYTNAGKSSLLNLLTSSDILAEDLLFATLDTTTRQCWLSPEVQFLLSDTVGFIRDLPSDLKRAFRATLDELLDSDILLHVVDGSHPYYQEHLLAVEDLLEELAADAIPRITVFNKTDLLTPEEQDKVTSQYPYLLISITHQQAVEELKAQIENRIRQLPKN